MPITSILTVTKDRICLNPHEGRAVLGALGENCMPGQVVNKFDSTGVWMLADTDDSNNAMGLSRIGIVGYEKRVNPSTMALKTITAVWTYNSAGDKLVPIWTSGICVAFCVDINTTWPAGGDLRISSTAGSFTVSVLQTNVSTTAGTLYTDYHVVATAASRIADGDTICIVGIGKNFGDIWGGINRS
jgi:hypothetical protein